MSEEKKYPITSVNRGRYLCLEHGSFCDSSDNYISYCPLCDDKKAKQKTWQINPVDRTLQTLNNLQGRSKRNVALLAGLFGSIGLIRLSETIANDGFEPFKGSVVLFLLSIICLLASLGFYGWSMGHVKLNRKNHAPEKTVLGWAKYFSQELGKMEIRHIRAGYAFSTGVLAMIFAVLFQLICAEFNICSMCVKQ